MLALSAADEQVVADLAWDYCERVRRGEQVSMEPYLRRCPNHEARTHFKKVANMSGLLDVAVHLAEFEA